MTARFHTAGRDNWANPRGQTVWQRERMRGPIAPMLPTPRPSFLARALAIFYSGDRS